MNEYKEVKIAVSNTFSKDFNLLVENELDDCKELFHQQDCLTLSETIKKLKEYLTFVRTIHNDPIGFQALAFIRELDGWIEDEVEFVK